MKWAECGVKWHVMLIYLSCAIKMQIFRNFSHISWNFWKMIPSNHVFLFILMMHSYINGFYESPWAKYICVRIWPCLSDSMTWLDTNFSPLLRTMHIHLYRNAKTHLFSKVNWPNKGITLNTIYLNWISFEMDFFLFCEIWRLARVCVCSDLFDFNRIMNNFTTS